MRIAVISDIHGNYESLKSVVDDINNSNVDYIVCLGDIVGYGPEPERVIGYIIKKKIPCVLGNHELAIFDGTELSGFNADARESIRITKDLISKHSLEFIKKLPKSLVKGGFLFVHGCPPDTVSQYIDEIYNFDLVDIFKKIKHKVSFVGHTHALMLYSCDGKKIIKKELQKGIKNLNKNQKHIVNVGSVGQPRDGNNNAKYVIFDDKILTIETKFIPYDIEATVHLIKELGFPKNNASRLW
jgi:predicted phosphodiesterase